MDYKHPDPVEVETKDTKKLEEIVNPIEGANLDVLVVNKEPLPVHEEQLAKLDRHYQKLIRDIKFWGEAIVKSKEALDPVQLPDGVKDSMMETFAFAEKSLVHHTQRSSDHLKDAQKNIRNDLSYRKMISTNKRKQSESNSPEFGEGKEKKQKVGPNPNHKLEVAMARLLAGKMEQLLEDDDPDLTQLVIVARDTALFLQAKQEWFREYVKKEYQPQVGLVEKTKKVIKHLTEGDEFELARELLDFVKGT